MEGGEDGVVDVLGRPAADMTAGMQEDFEEADDARVVDLDAGIAHRADGDRKSKALQQRKVDMDIEPLRLEALPRILRFRRVPKISVILSAVRRHKPSSQLRSNSLWMGKLRLKMKLRQYSIWAIA